MFRQRFRVTFRKHGEVRFVGHADTMRVFERALRRSALPLRMSEGFNPHPRISFPAPLAVGWEGECEVMEFELADWVALEEVGERLRAQMPPGLDVLNVRFAPPTGKARATEAEYQADPITPSSATRVGPEAVAAFMAAEEIWAERQRADRVKRDNIRPFVREVKLKDNGGLWMRVAVSPEGTARPDEVLTALGVSPEDARGAWSIRRTELRLRG